MRISIFLLLIAAFQLSAVNTYSQHATVHISKSNMSVYEFIAEVEKQTNYLFLYSEKEIDMNQQVHINASDKPVSEVLKQVFSTGEIVYSFNEDYISLRKRSQSLPAVNQDKKIITGTITDENGEPIIGANVMEKGIQNGVVTDVAGNFSIHVLSNAVLRISYIGYLTQDVIIGNRQQVTIKLKEDTQSLEEVVVVGYGTQRKGSLATAISTVKADVLQNRSVQTIGEAIQGQVPGLSVVSSGKPGTAPSIRLRGTTSLNDSGGPLVLVDGVPGDFNFLNSDDIESINILKDAASSAIYGSRAANGVMLITTKRGKLGKPVFRYNGSVGINTPTNMPKPVSSSRYARALNEAEMNMNRTPLWKEDEIALFENGTDPNRYPNTNWLELALQNSVTTRHGIEASGGTERVKYLLSAGMDIQTGVFPEVSQDVFNVRSNTDIAISKKFNISFDIRYQQRKMDEVDAMEDKYKLLLGAGPTMVAYYTDGSYGSNAGFTVNPLVDLFESGHINTDRHDASGIFKLDYEIIDGLKFTGIANVNYVFKNASTRSNKLYYKNFFTEEVTEKGVNGLSERNDHSAYYNLQALLNYKKSFGDHNIDALMGYQQENSKSSWVKAGRSGYPTDLVWVLDGGPKDNWSNEGTAEHWAIASVIGRLNYDYAGKYMLTASFRSDASSRFAAGNRWATFPSVAAAWRISQESFMKGTSGFIDDLKIRVSWGQNGASSGLGLYPSYSTMAMDAVVLNNVYLQTAKLNTIGNKALNWERTEMFNVGLDYRTLNGRLGFSGEYYVKTTNDILIKLPVPLEYGFGDQPVNIGSVKNNGWELEISWNDRIDDFSYGISGNISDNRNNVEDLGGTGPWKGGYTDVGLPFKSSYGYESLGLFQSDEEVKNAPFQNSRTGAGDVRYKDQLTIDTNGDGIPDKADGKIDADDRVVIGDPYPHFLFGLNLNAEYKGFDFRALFQGIGKKDMVFASTDAAIRPLFDSPLMEHQLDYWSDENRDAKYPRLLKSDEGVHNYEKSDFWKINAGYLRVKNLQIGYSLPQHILKQTGFSRIRVYVSANNLFTISNFVPGWDPEVSKALTYPFARTYSFGLNVQF